MSWRGDSRSRSPSTDDLRPRRRSVTPTKRRGKSSTRRRSPRRGGARSPKRKRSHSSKRKRWSRSPRRRRSLSPRRSSGSPRRKGRSSRRRRRKKSSRRKQRSRRKRRGRRSCRRSESSSSSSESRSPRRVKRSHRRRRRKRYYSESSSSSESDANSDSCSSSSYSGKRGRRRRRRIPRGRGGVFRVGDHIEMKLRHQGSGWVPAIIVDISENGLDYSVRFPGKTRIEEFVRQDHLRFSNRRNQRDPNCVQFRRKDDPLQNILLMDPGEAEFNKRTSHSQPARKYVKIEKVQLENNMPSRTNRSLSLPCDIHHQPLSFNLAVCAQWAKGLTKPPGDPSRKKENDETFDISIPDHQVMEISNEDIPNNQEDSKEIPNDLQPETNFYDKPASVHEGKFSDEEQTDDRMGYRKVPSLTFNIFPRCDTAAMKEWKRWFNVNSSNVKE